MKKHLLTIIALGGALSVNAQSDSTEAAELSLLNKTQHLQPIEIRSLRASDDAPFVKTELNKKDIEKANLGQDLPYLLQYTPSTVVTSDAGAGVGYTGIRVRGTDGTRINVTMNGVPVNDAESQGSFFVDFPDIASSTGSIQLQRGVGTSTNGAGAFGATMSISNLQQFEEAGAELMNTYGSFNTWRHTLRAGTGMLKHGFQFDVRLSKVNSSGYINRSASDLRSAQFIAGWKASEKTQLRFMLMTGQEKTGQAWNGVPEDSIDTNPQYNELGMKADGSFYKNQTDNYQQDYYQLFLDHKFSKYLSGHAALFLTRGKGYYEEYKLGQSYSAYGFANYITPTGRDTFTNTDLTRQLWLDNYYYGSVFSLIYERFNTQITFGGGWNQYQGNHYGNVLWTMNGGIPDNYRWYDLDAQKNDLNFYVKLQEKLGKNVILFGDVQYRNVAYNIYGFRDNPNVTPMPTYNFINPKAGITYKLRNNSKQQQKLFASAAVANKEPNRNDFEASPVSQPKAEQLLDIEAGYEIVKRSWSLNANYYYMHYNNQLILTGQINDVGAYTRTNVPKSYRMGLELQGVYVARHWLKLNANATVSQNKISNFTEYIDDYDAGDQAVINHGTTDIAFSPNLIAAGGATFSPFRYMGKGQVFEIDLLGKYVGRQYLDNTGNDQRSIDSYGLCDVRVRYSIKTKPFRELGFNIMLNNVFNTRYASNGYTYSYIISNQLNTVNYYYPQAGFNWLLGVTMKW